MQRTGRDVMVLELERLDGLVSRFLGVSERR
jgi:hypothetical protein